MTEKESKGTYDIHCGDVRHCDHLQPNSIHAVITDPPYGLSFLGSDWDKVLPPQAVWSRCFDLLKPGGFLIAFGHCRLYHRLACDIEDAGFLIKDCMCWGYATNFPKSYNISKAIDKRNGFEQKIVGTKAGLPGYSLSEEKNPGGYSGIRYDPEKECAIYEAVSDDAKTWHGWGTALKTGWEPIVLAQKPLEGNYVDNILKWKVGALNIDECRIPFESKEDEERLRSFMNFTKKDHGNAAYFSCNEGNKKQVNVHSSGRWPANLMWLDPLFADYDRIFMIPKPSASEKGEFNDHITVKPVRLMSHLIKLLTPKPSVIGEKVYVLDPFMGSGTTGVSCNELGRNFIGFDTNKDSFEIARKRVSQPIANRDIFEV